LKNKDKRELYREFSVGGIFRKKIFQGPNIDE